MPITAVYDQIELMSRIPKTRRSKSFTRHDRSSISRTSSPQHDPTTINPPSVSKPRQSLDGQTITPVPSSGAASRTSFEKARAIRMFSNNKSSVDVELPPGHKKTDSLKSESLKSFPDDETHNPAEVTFRYFLLRFFFPLNAIWPPLRMPPCFGSSMILCGLHQR